MVNSSQSTVHRISNYLLPTTNYKLKRGFTLIEILVVISILGIMAGLLLASYGNAQAKSRDSKRKTDLDTIKKALELAKQDTTGQYYYPDLLSSLAPTYTKTVPLDPKTNANYTYTPAPTSCTTACTDYTLISCLENANDTQGVTDATNCPAAPQKAYKVTPN